MIHFADKTRRRTDLEIDFAKTICTFDAKIMKKTGQIDWRNKNNTYICSEILWTRLLSDIVKSIGKASPSCHGLAKLWKRGARHNDAVIGRWHSMDQLAEEHPQFSPYSYCMGDPVNLGDYNGMIPTFEEGAALANHVYEGMENEQVGDWTCISITVNKSNGLRYGIYSHKKDT